MFTNNLCECNTPASHKHILIITFGELGVQSTSGIGLGVVNRSRGVAVTCLNNVNRNSTLLSLEYDDKDGNNSHYY